jgi:transposase
MQGITTIGLDLAKRVFHVHGVNQEGQVVVDKRIQRSEMLSWFGKLSPCLVGIESCATSNYWARELMKLGHRVKLIPPACVKPYVRRQKNDRADAAAICEAVARPSMRFVAICGVGKSSYRFTSRKGFFRNFDAAHGAGPAMTAGE